MIAASPSESNYVLYRPVLELNYLAPGLNYLALELELFLREPKKSSISIRCLKISVQTIKNLKSRCGLCEPRLKSQYFVIDRYSISQSTILVCERTFSRSSLGRKTVYLTSIRFTHAKISSINFLRTTWYMFSISSMMKDGTLHTGFQSDYPTSVKPIVRPHYLQRHPPIFQPTGRSHAQTEVL